MPHLPDDQPAVTVVMATRNRRDDAVRALSELDRLHPTTPLVVVDNASTDGTAEAVAEAVPRCRVIRLTRNAGACARNEGARTATTPYVAFSDDDSWWAEGALQRAAEVMDAHPSVAVVMARLLVGRQEALDPTCAAMAQAPLGAADGTTFPRIVGFVACGAVVRRSAFLEAGGFHPVVRFPGEEQVLTIDLMAGGWDLVHVEEVVAHHDPQPRADRADRTSDMLRSQLLTTWLRQPWWECVRATGGVLLHSVRSPQHRRALAQALARAPQVVPRRHLAPPHVRRDVARGAT